MAAGAAASGTTLPLWSWRKKSVSLGRLAQRLFLAAPTPSVRHLSAGSPAGGTSVKVVRSCWEGKLIRFTEGTRKEAQWSDIIRYRFINNVDRMIWNLPFHTLLPRSVTTLSTVLCLSMQFPCPIQKPSSSCRFPSSLRTCVRPSTRGWPLPWCVQETWPEGRVPAMWVLSVVST